MHTSSGAGYVVIIIASSVCILVPSICRFCSKDYVPFDAREPKKYVVDDEYTHPSEVPPAIAIVIQYTVSGVCSLSADPFNGASGVRAIIQLQRGLEHFVREKR